MISKQKWNDRIQRTVSSHPWLKLIEHDFYDICSRVQKIDPGYFIFLNRKTGNYEVHYSGNKGLSSYCFTVPYDSLDVRTIDYLMETSPGYRARLLHRMEENNKKLDASRDRDFSNTMEAASYELAAELTLALDRDDLYDGYKRTFGGGA